MGAGTRTAHSPRPGARHGLRASGWRASPRVARRIALYAVLIGLSFLFALPFLWQFSAAFKTNAEIIQPGLNLIPDSLRLENFNEALNAVPFDLWFYNSLFIACWAPSGPRCRRRSALTGSRSCGRGAAASASDWR